MGVFKKVASKIIDVRVDKWMSWEYLSDTTGRFKSILLSVVIPQKPKYAETFEEAMQRLHLREEDIQNRLKEFYRLCYFFIALSAILVSYALYLAYTLKLAASLISFCLALYSLSQAFRFHFWIFQLKNRKLGCSIKEWLNSKVLHTPSTELQEVKPSRRMKQKAKDEE